MTLYASGGQLSPRQYRPCPREALRIPVSDGIEIAAEMVRPDAPGRFPVLLGYHPYPNDEQFEHRVPAAFSNALAHVEAGDSDFFARRGYIHVVASVRGTGQSGGSFGNLDARTVRDIYEVIEWLARQPFCDGQVAMFGMSYFSIVQQHVAALAPPSLKTIFAPYGWNDMYRDRYYRGGILVHGFMRLWIPSLHRLRVTSPVRQQLGEAAYRARIAAALADPEIAAVPFLVDALQNVDQGANCLVADTVIQPLDGPYYRERSLDWARVRNPIPAYFGACWGIYGLHLGGSVRAFEHWAGPRRLTIGPPLYLDRPIYQYHEEALRWFDHWLKRNDTGMLAEPPVQLFVDGTGEWKQAHDWPLPGTRWTPFHLRQNGLLLDQDPGPADTTSSFVDGPGERGGLQFWTPRAVEATEICGPIALNLFAETTDVDVLWFISLLLEDEQGGQRLLTRGWLRGSQRALDPTQSRPWQPAHLHQAREALAPGQVHAFNIEVRPYALLLKPGQRLGLRVRCCDDESPTTLLEAIGTGSVAQQNRATVTLHHSPDHPSHLLLPITRGNRLGMFVSGGVPAALDAPVASRH